MTLVLLGFWLHDIHREENAMMHTPKRLHFLQKQRLGILLMFGCQFMGLNACSGILPEQHATGNCYVKRMFGAELRDFDHTIAGVDHIRIYPINFIAKYKRHGLMVELYILQHDRCIRLFDGKYLKPPRFQIHDGIHR